MKKLKLFSLAWPIFIETALFMLLGFIDVLVLSSYDELAAASVNTANQSVSIVTIVFSVISGASAVLISQLLGAKRRQDASKIAALSIFFNLVFGIVISILLVVFSKPLLIFIGAKGKLLAFSSDYLRIVGGFIFMQAVLASMTVIIRNHGLTKVSMFVTVGMNITNTVLDIILVPHFGVKGVAFATTFSRVVGAVALAVVLFKKIESIKIFRFLKPMPWKDFGSMIKIGVPTALESTLYNLSQLVITSIVLNHLTDNELNAKTYIQSVTMFFYIFAVAIGQASQIITGHLVGAGDTEKAYKNGINAYFKALMITLSIAALGVVFRYQLIGIFSDNKDVVEFGANILFINFVLEFGRTTNLVLIACLRGAGDVYFPTGCAIVSNWLVSVLGSYILAVVCGFGIYGLFVALAGDEVFRGILMIWRFKSGKWKTKKVINKA